MRRQLYVLLDLAAEMKAAPHGWETALHGDTVAMFFEKPSTRTRVSFAAACQHLGALPLGLRPDELQLGRGEPISDTARVLSGYASAIVVRTFAQAVLDEMAEPPPRSRSSTPSPTTIIPARPWPIS